MQPVGFNEREMNKRIERINEAERLKSLKIHRTKEVEKETFEQAVKPLMKWLCENTHPHTTAIVTGTLAELVEGVENVITDEFVID